MTAPSICREPLWSALRQRSTPASAPELAGAIGLADPRIGWWLSRWAGQGLLSAVKPSTNPPSGDKRTRYLMEDDARTLPLPPARSGGRKAMWRAMRVLRRFDLVQLTLAAETTENAAKQYVSFLLRAGILRRERRGHAKSGQRSIYALAGQFGPQPPIVRTRSENGQRIQEVTDPNTGITREISACPPCAPLF